MTSFRLVLVNNDEFSKNIWEGLDLPYIQIYGEKFCNYLLFESKFTGNCIPIYEMLPGTVHFTITARTGNLKRVEKAYLEVIEILRSQQYAKTVNLVFQENFASCKFQAQALLGIHKDDPSHVYLKQPSYYPYDNILINLMEIVLPGITEYGKSTGFPETNLEKTLASEFIPLELECENSPKNPYQNMPKITLANNQFCSICSASLIGQKIIILKCGHSIHEICIENYLRNSICKENLQCPACGLFIDLDIIKLINK